MSYEAWRREVEHGTMHEGTIGGPRTMRCEGCGKWAWEDEVAQRGLHGTAFCYDCDPLRGMEHCDGCGFDAASCQCDQRTA